MPAVPPPGDHPFDVELRAQERDAINTARAFQVEAERAGQTTLDHRPSLGEHLRRALRRG